METSTRDIVYCHQCENEWYRDEGGLTCPECQSDFTEIVEGNNDPRAQQEAEDEQPPASAASHPLHAHDPWNAPDPDEEDIDHFDHSRWQQGPSYHATFNRTYDLDGRGQVQGQAPGAAGGGLLGMIGNMVGGLLQQQQQQQQQQGQGQGQQGAHDRWEGQGNDGQTRAGSVPGSPRSAEQQQQQQEARPGVYTRHVHGPGYSFTMTATSGNLSPRNANTAQPLNAQPHDMDDLLQQMFNNIGGFPPLIPGQDPRQNEQNRGAGGHPVFPGTLLQLLNNLGPPGGVHGDAVYSQEALDRIVSRMMDEHQTGNAPGPASETAIRSLPTRPITEADEGDSGSADCSICMDTVPRGEAVTVLPCSHWFHHDCIRAWLGEHDTCPVCRKGIMPRDSAAEGGEGARARARASGQEPLHDQSTAATAPSGNSNSNSSGLLNRMRDVFGGGSGGGGSSSGRTADNNNDNDNDNSGSGAGST